MSLELQSPPKAGPNPYQEQEIVIRKVVWLAFTLGNAGILAAQTPSGFTNLESEVMSVEQTRTAALDRSDIAALDRIMADESPTFMPAARWTQSKVISMPSVPASFTIFLGSRRVSTSAFSETVPPSSMANMPCASLTPASSPTHSTSLASFSPSTSAVTDIGSRSPGNPPVTSQPRLRNNR
jgi:hypothetical protein